MAKYTVCLLVYAEKYVEVEAEDEEEAKTKAMESEENSFSLCCHCSDHFELADSSASEAIIV